MNGKLDTRKKILISKKHGIAINLVTLVMGREFGSKIFTNPIDSSLDLI
jgi:hypothetical protein